jgi:hypothetical protein
MTNSLRTPFADLLDAGLPGRLRRNHGLEHATLHILSSRYPRSRLGGYSEPGGFWIIGDLELEDVASAVKEAIERLGSGEAGLAIHPYCGTNLAVALALAGSAAAVSMLGVGPRRRQRLARLPLAALLVGLALWAARPLGLFLQTRLTTSGQPGDLQPTAVYLYRQGRVKAYRITTRG